MGAGAVDERLWVIPAFISSPKPPFVPPVLVYYKTNAPVGASILSPQHCPWQPRAGVTQPLMAICSLQGGLGGFWATLGWRVAVESWFRPILTDISMAKVWSPLWCHLRQVKVTQLDIKFWLWGDANCPRSWVRIYKSCPQRGRNWYRQNRPRLEAISKHFTISFEISTSRSSVRNTLKTLIFFPPHPRSTDHYRKGQNLIK